MNMRILRVLCPLLLLAVTARAADDPFTGTWKLNIAKSKLLVGDKTKSDIYHMIADDNTIQFSDEVVLDKEVRNITVDAKFDGKYYAIKGDPDTDAVAYQRNGNTVTAMLKKSGKVVGKDRVVVSPDGQVTTVTFTIYSEEKPQTGTAVYEKQPN
jgi:hypothetical protein